MTAAVDRSGQVPLRDAAQSWPVLSSAEQARGPIVTLRSDQVRMPDGDVVPRQVVQHPGAVAVVALNEAGQVLLIRQYRHPVGRLLWEVPAGLRDVAGEPLHATAVRELLEETGYAAADWHVLVDYFSSPGISTERIRVFLARELRQVPDEERSYVASHEEAQLVLRWVDLATAVDRFMVGDLHNGVTAVGILSAYAARCGGFTGLRPADAPED
ncbi:MAG TPA: NUDIX hydrolase [Streptosporangiaceae bacterium]|nr:NUDIX hydrolase [Streptosporangiaceae bacterium]